jgi:hypothetical protein
MKKKRFRICFHLLVFFKERKASNCIYRKIGGIWWTDELDEERRIVVQEASQRILVSFSVCRIALMLTVLIFLCKMCSIGQSESRKPNLNLAELENNLSKPNWTVATSLRTWTKLNLQFGARRFKFLNWIKLNCTVSRMIHELYWKNLGFLLMKLNYNLEKYMD